MTETRVTGYAALRQSLLESLRPLADELAQPALMQRLASLRDKLERDRFHLAVLGQFKRGKTTFINSLLGAEVLPTGVVPLTSIVTFVEYGREPEAIVHFSNQPSRAISLSDVAGYVTERGNPHNVKNVARVDVHYPAAMLRDGVVLIDTPGIGSTYDHNTDITYQFLPQVDAAIFVASVDPPLSRAEKDFLGAIREYAAKLFFVLNKVDYVDASEQRELLEFLRTVLATELGIVEPKIFPLSAKRALAASMCGGDDGGLAPFRANLEPFLLREKGQVVLTTTVTAALRLASEARFLFDIERRALATPIEELERKLVEFEQLRAQAEREHRDFQHLLKAEANELMAALDEELATLKTGAVPVLECALREFADRRPELKGRHLGRALQEELKRALIDRFEAWRRAKERRLDAEFQRLSGRFVAAADQIIARVVELSAALFDVPPIPLAGGEGLSAESRLYYLVGDAPVLLSIEPIYFWTLLPGRITRRFVLADALKHVLQESDRNCGRLRYDFLTRIEKSLDRFSQNLATRIRVTLDNIHSAIAAGTLARERSNEEAKSRQSSIDAHMAIVSAVEQRLNAIREQAAQL
ncbi:MAG TPA: dynamin family protein [Candidatus Kryptonia bacterium]|nr:dynamin family protein [Candidatus Kryptonia bacterium]